MVELETTVHRCHGVTFVAVTLTNRRETPQRVTLRNTLSGPTWPPRKRGVSPAWDGRTWQGVLEAESCRGVGFASPAEPAGPVVELVGSERHTDRRETDVRTVLADRPSATPPRVGGRS